MAIVKVTITTVDTPLPAGETFAQYLYKVLAADGVTVVQTGAATALDFTFPADVPAGTYSATAQAEDPAAVAFGPVATAAFTVPAVATFAAPATITVALS